MLIHGYIFGSTQAKSFYIGGCSITGGYIFGEGADGNTFDGGYVGEGADGYIFVHVGSYISQDNSYSNPASPVSGHGGFGCLPHFNSD